jgi:alpha-glucosidase
VYYGEELGMRNGRLRYRDLRDPYTKRFWPFRPGRDPARTPMQWSAEAHAGFTTARQAWLPVATDYKQYNSETERADAHSFFALYRTLIHLRSNTPVLLHGSITLLEAHHPDVLAFRRSKKGERERYITLINFSDKVVRLNLAALPLRKLVLSSRPDSQLSGDAFKGNIELLPHEGALFLE